MRYLLLPLILILCLPTASAETVWADRVSEDIQITYTLISEDFTDTAGGVTYNVGLGGNAVHGEQEVVDPQKGMDDQFDLLDGDRLELEVTREGDPIDVGVHSDYHLAFLPLSVDGQDIFSLLFGNVTLVELLTNSTYLNSTIGNLITLDVIYAGTYNVTYTWDSTTAILVHKEVFDPQGNQLLIAAGSLQDAFDLLPVPLLPAAIGLLAALVITRDYGRR